MSSNKPLPPPMTYWPEFETAPVRDICAGLSATLASPRGNADAGVGYGTNPQARLGKIERARAAHRAKVGGSSD